MSYSSSLSNVSKKSGLLYAPVLPQGTISKLHRSCAQTQNTVQFGPFLSVTFYLFLLYFPAATVTMSGATPGSRSSFAKHATLPPIPATATVTSATPDPSEQAREEGAGGGGNPFQMPPESELFTLREAQRAQAKAERAGQRKLKVHEKSTYASRLNSKNASLRKKASMRIL